ncbi:MAG: VWA domain-containing protein [Pyrinomonadaceae bacterium]
MKKVLACCTSLLLSFVALAQTPTTPTSQDEDVLRITAQLVQVDAVVTDKNDQVIPDLKLSDFEIYDNGKKQDLQFVEFVSADAAPRTEGRIDIAGQTIEPNVTRNLTAKDLRRVFAFVVDDLTIPYDDIVNVRTMLRDFVDNQMREGDLVVIFRVIGGSGLLLLFTSDKNLLRRAISQINARQHPLSAFNNLPSQDKINTELMNAAGDEGGAAAAAPVDGISAANGNPDASEDGTIKGMRTLTTLSVTSDVVNSMKGLPGRKSLVLISGGLPLAETSPTQVKLGGAPVTIMESHSYQSNVNYLIRQLTDRSSRAGVVINTLDIRGMKASRGVSGFTDPGNEAKSALFDGSSSGGGFGRTADLAQFDNQGLDTLSGHLGLSVLASATGGVSVVNTNNFREGLDRVLSRSSYYLLAYRPSEPFDNKFHKYQIKVTRPGAKVYTRAGYIARADEAERALTKEQTIVRAAMSPLAKSDLNLSSTLQYRFTPENSAAVDINLVIDANKLDFKQGTDGKYQTSFDVVGFVVNSLGKSQDGFSQTINASLSPEEYRRALASGISFTGHAELPPGTYQLRAAVRESSTGRLGSMSQYLEVPDLSKKRLAVSSLFLYGVDMTQGGKAAPEPLNGVRLLQRKKDLRYAALIYNPKLIDGKPRLTTQAIITRGDKVVFRGSEQPLTGSAQGGQFAKIDQFGLSKLQPGQYVLTLVVTDPQADKDDRTVVRSIDFTLID